MSWKLFVHHNTLTCNNSWRTRYNYYFNFQDDDDAERTAKDIAEDLVDQAQTEIKGKKKKKAANLANLIKKKQGKDDWTED